MARLWADKQIFYNNFDFDIKSDYLLSGVDEMGIDRIQEPLVKFDKIMKNYEFPEKVFQ